MKLKNRKGFTLMEILIVVAIIAILVAIAIPTFSSALTKANVATDKANIRAAYAECLMACMLDDTVDFPTETEFKTKVGTLKSGKTIAWTVDTASGDLTITFEGMALTVEKALLTASTG